MCRVVVVLENYVLVVVNKDRNVAYDISLKHFEITTLNKQHFSKTCKQLKLANVITYNISQ